jgi:hypothetical protein
LEIWYGSCCMLRFKERKLCDSMRLLVVFMLVSLCVFCVLLVCLEPFFDP